MMGQQFDKVKDLIPTDEVSGEKSIRRAEVMDRHCLDFAGDRKKPPWQKKLGRATREGNYLETNIWAGLPRQLFLRRYMEPFYRTMASNHSMVLLCGM